MIRIGTGGIPGFAQATRLAAIALGLSALGSCHDSNPPPPVQVDGEVGDTDGDGVADWLESGGYTFDWTTGDYVPWSLEDVKRDPTVPYFKSDPRQYSTDQDPFGDGAEVSQFLMDVAIDYPGDHPMVPAYPDIVVTLERYEVTLNQDITTTTGRSLQNGESWNTETYDLHTHTEETSWQHQGSASISISDLFGAAVGYSYSEGERTADSVQSGTVSSHGGSRLETLDWQAATCSNPSDAARMKLMLKVHNYGSAPASNIVPTLTLQIGKRSIATFEPGNAQIHMLEPGGVYPATPGLYWTIDTYDTGATVAPISLTLDELKALETGAPVNVVVTQVLADVLTMDEEGRWVNVGDWHEYMARVESVSARLFFDVGDGNVIDYLVCADDRPSCPGVTLRDALLWVAGGAEENGEQKICYFDRVNDGRAEASLEGWSVNVDAATWLANQSVQGGNLLDAVLHPDSMIILKAPRTDQPEVHYAYLDERTDLVHTYVSDYHGVVSAEFLEDQDAPSPIVHQMTAQEGMGYYTLQLPDSYQKTGREAIRVIDAESPPQETVESVEVIPDPRFIPPAIQEVFLDFNTYEVEAQVDHQGGTAITGVYFTLISDPDLQSVPMQRIADDRWLYDIGREPEGWASYILVHAINSMGYLVSEGVTRSAFYHGGMEGFDLYLAETTNAVDFDHESGYRYGGFDPNTSAFWTQSEFDLLCMLKRLPPLPRSELLRVSHNVRWFVLPGSWGFDYRTISRKDMEFWDPLIRAATRSIDAQFYVRENDILLLHTGEHYVKILFDNRYQFPDDPFWRTLRIFANPETGG